MIENLTYEDFDRIVKLENICFEHDAFTPSFFEELFSDERVIFLGIKIDNELAAMTMFYNWEGLNDYVKIISMSVHPNHRHNGFASLLMSKMIEFAKEHHLIKLSAETRKSNNAMQSIFEKFNCKLEYEVIDYYDNPNENAYRYTCYLDT